jgi:hypothetical protein
MCHLKAVPAVRLLVAFCCVLCFLLPTTSGLWLPGNSNSNSNSNSTLHIIIKSIGNWQHTTDNRQHTTDNAVAARGGAGNRGPRSPPPPALAQDLRHSRDTYTIHTSYIHQRPWISVAWRPYTSSIELRTWDLLGAYKTAGMIWRLPAPTGTPGFLNSKAGEILSTSPQHTPNFFLHTSYMR